MQYKEANHISHFKTLQIIFLFENEQLAEIDFLTGNDLETCEILYFASFCTISKERFS